MKLKLIPFLLLLLCSCHNNNNEIEKSNQISNDSNEKVKINKLISKILKSGDTVAYKELEYIYFKNEQEAEFFYYSNFMAENYSYPRALMTNYRILKVGAKNLTTSKIANYYLLRAYENGSKSAIFSIKERFPQGHIPKSIDYLCNIKQ